MHIHTYIHTYINGHVWGEGREILRDVLRTLIMGATTVTNKSSWTQHSFFTAEELRAICHDAKDKLERKPAGVPYLRDSA